MIVAAIFLRRAILVLALRLRGGVLLTLRGGLSFLGEVLKHAVLQFGDTTVGGGRRAALLRFLLLLYRVELILILPQ